MRREGCRGGSGGPQEEEEEEHCCSHESSSVATQQSLEELDFHRSLAGAAQANDLPRMRSLLDRGASVDGDAATPGYSPLHYAARQGHLEACLLLLQNGAQVNRCTRAGRATSLHRAAYAGHVKVVETLLQAGADLHAKDSDGFTPLKKAEAQGHMDVLKVLTDAIYTSSSEKQLG